MQPSDLFTPRMPVLDPRLDLESIFTRARQAAKKSIDGHRQVIIVSPGRLLLARACPLADDLDPASLAALELLAPPERKRNIAAIAYTEVEALKTYIRTAIPFWDFLAGLGSIGHSVWIFEGHPDAIMAGCREADLLLVDEGMLPYLGEESDWRSAALVTMRRANIRVIPRVASAH
jgi:hypothetical protein